MAQFCRAHQVEIWAYCLMPNHVHLIAVPQSADGLRRAIGEAHRRYTRMVNFREGWRGHLWQGRFASFVLDEPYLLTAARYVELNPVRAGLVNAPRQYRWSSAAAHLRGRDDALVRVAPLLQLAPDWRRFLTRVIREEDLKLLRAHEHTGRPLGEEAFLASLEQNLGRILRRQKPGPKGKPRGLSRCSRRIPGPENLYAPIKAWVEIAFLDQGLAYGDGIGMIHRKNDDRRPTDGGLAGK